MNKSKGFNCRAVLRWIALSAMLSSSGFLAGCATHYVDTATTDVPVSAYRKVESPKPVQFLFEFQTKGVANARATEILKGQIVEQVKASGLFSAVDEKPIPGGAILAMTLNNVPLTDNAFGKGFVTGLTFGLAGSQVTDGYICTVDYSGGVPNAAITKTARHAIHTVIGAKGAPVNVEPAKSVDDAVRTMARQIVATVLRDLSLDPAFQ